MKFKIFIIAVFIIIISILWFLFGGGEDAVNLGENSDSSAEIFKEEKSEKSDSVSMTPPASAQTKKYENIQLGFSFSYPSDFTVREFPEDGGKIALIIQNKKTSQTVQIYITSYDDSDFAVSAEQIKHDLPDLPFSNSADVIAGGKAKGVAFFSQNEAFGGATAEVWFADGKNFYQATAYGKDAKILEEIIKSWKFQ